MFCESSLNNQLRVNIHECVDFICVLLLVFPVVEIDRVSPGGTNTNVSWFVQGNLTQLNFLCQITVDPDSNTEVGFIQFISNIHTAEVEVQVGFL